MAGKHLIFSSKLLLLALNVYNYKKFQGFFYWHPAMDASFADYFLIHIHIHIFQVFLTAKRLNPFLTIHLVISIFSDLFPVLYASERFANRFEDLFEKEIEKREKEWKRRDSNR